MQNLQKLVIKPLINITREFIKVLKNKVEEICELQGLFHISRKILQILKNRIKMKQCKNGIGRFLL